MHPKMATLDGAVEVLTCKKGSCYEGNFYASNFDLTVMKTVSFYESNISRKGASPLRNVPPGSFLKYF